MPKDISTTTTDFTKHQSTSQLDKEPRGVLNKLNRLFSQNEPVMGYGDNVVVPVSPPVLNRRRIVPAFNSYNYDYYDDAGQNNNRQNLVVQNNMNRCIILNNLCLRVVLTIVLFSLRILLCDNSSHSQTITVLF